MRRAQVVRWLCLLVLLHVAWSSACANTGVIFAIDFARPADEPASWLRQEGFEFKLDAALLDAHFSERGLVLATDDQLAGLFVKALDLPGAKRVRVIWGIDRYPHGADWDRGKGRVPLAVMFWLGKEKLESGGLFVPDSPYFTGVFIGDKDQEGKPYTGSYYKKGGRYFCKPCETREGDTVVTEFDLEKAFKSAFGRPDMPPVSGFGFQVNTRGTSGGSSAFIRRVEFLGS